MSRRGPAPTPTAILKRRGSRISSKGRPKGKEPVAVKGTMTMPDAVKNDALAKAAWLDTLPHLIKMNTVAKADLMALTGLCLAWSRAHKADRQVRKYGLVTKLFSGAIAANPAVAMSRNAWSEVRKFLQEFGMTPSSRTRVREMAEDTAAPTGGQQGESTEQWLFGARTGTDHSGGRIAGHIPHR